MERVGIVPATVGFHADIPVAAITTDVSCSSSGVFTDKSTVAGATHFFGLEIPGVPPSAGSCVIRIPGAVVATNVGEALGVVVADTIHNACWAIVCQAGSGCKVQSIGRLAGAAVLLGIEPLPIKGSAVSLVALVPVAAVAIRVTVDGRVNAVETTRAGTAVVLGNKWPVIPPAALS